MDPNSDSKCTGELSEGLTPIGERSAVQLIEVGGLERRLADPRSSDASGLEDPPIIYVEFVRTIPSEFINAQEATAEDANESANPDDEKLKAFLRERNLQLAEQSFPPEAAPDRARFMTLYFESNVGIKQVCQELNQFPQVADAVVAPKLRPTACDPLAEPLIGNPLSDQVVTVMGFDNQWYIPRCLIHLAWRQGFTGIGVVIADIDWGFRTSHDDLKDRITRQWNTRHNDNNVSRGDSIWHGTAVLGLAGADCNGKGMAGVTCGANLWAIQVGERSGLVDAPFWWDALDQVSGWDSGGLRKIIILEVETIDAENIELIPQIRTAIDSAIAAGSVVCVAAGNGHRDAGVDKNNNPFPATGSILVGATSYDSSENLLADFSNFGSRVTVYAPGDQKHDLTCSSGAHNAYMNKFGGTSGATPKVAGTIALMLEANPNLTHFQIKEILRETGSPITTDIPNAAGVFLNAEQAVCEALRRRSGVPRRCELNQAWG
jgi:subtilisin family serine protease